MDSIIRKLSDRNAVNSAVGRAVKTALIAHKRANLSVPGFMDGQVKWFKASELKVG
jgi:hypothetical protein